MSYDYIDLVGVHGMVRQGSESMMSLNKSLRVSLFSLLFFFFLLNHVNDKLFE